MFPLKDNFRETTGIQLEVLEVIYKHQENSEKEN